MKGKLSTHVLDIQNGERLLVFQSHFGDSMKESGFY